MSEARASIGVYGPESIESDDLFLGLLRTAGLPVERLQFGPGHKTEPWEYTIVSGDAMLALYRPDLKAGECHGRPIWLSEGDRIIFPVLHHDSYRRHPPWRDELITEIRYLRELAKIRRAGGNWFPHTHITCVKCRGEFAFMDHQAVSYCEAHRP